MRIDLIEKRYGILEALLGFGTLRQVTKRLCVEEPALNTLVLPIVVVPICIENLLENITAYN